MAKSNRGIRMDDSTYDKLKVIATKDRRTTSNLIVSILEDYLHDYEAKHGTINITDSE